VIAFRTILDNTLHFLLTHSKTYHGKIVIGGLLIGLIYLPSWLWFVSVFTLVGSIFPMVSVCAVGLALTQLWQSRHTLKQPQASVSERRWGHSLIWFGIALFPFCWPKIWAQGLAWAIVLIGIALSSWGLQFFRQYTYPIALLLCTAYPPLILSLAERAWKIVAPPSILERFMAWAGSLVLKLLDSAATATDINLLLPTGGVSVLPACNGFEMMITMICITLLTGIAFQMRKWVILQLAVVGTLLALGLNVLRVALMAFAIAHWGNHAFEFWHGFWGGQIFSGLLFTIYYYLVMAQLPTNPSRPPGHADSAIVQQ
jgi:exosortase/archaeosortase family protein